MKTKVKVTISRYTRRDGYSIGIRITDSVSGIEVIDVDMELIDFAGCITGLASRSGIAEWRGLQYVGKKRITEKRQMVAPKIDRKEYGKWLEANAQEEGWMIDSYLGSQSSIVYKDGKTFLNYGVYKYVDNNEEAENEAD